MIDTRLIERYAAQAWPAAEAREEEGWLLRHTPGVPRRRSNSALPLARGEALLTALPRVEDFYAARGMPAAVQVASAEEHAALDGLLARRGYRRDAATLVYIAPAGTVITGSRPAVPLEVTVAEHPTRQWLDAYVALDGHENSQEAADQVLSRIPGPAAYLSAERGVLTRRPRRSAPRSARRRKPGPEENFSPYVARASRQGTIPDKRRYS